MLIDKMRQLICGLDGHQMLRHFEPTRLSLKCACGYETHGWEIKDSVHPIEVVEFEPRPSDLSGQMCSAR